jgi:hypothetical protein
MLKRQTEISKFTNVRSVHAIQLYAWMHGRISKAVDRGDKGFHPCITRRAAKHDYGYRRCGLCNVSLVCEPLAGKRMVKITERKTKLDSACFIEEIAGQYECLSINQQFPKKSSFRRKPESRVPGENRDPVFEMVPDFRRDDVWMPDQVRHDGKSALMDRQ